MSRESWARKTLFNLPPQFSRLGTQGPASFNLCGLRGCMSLCMCCLCGIYIYMYMYSVSLVGCLSFLSYFSVNS